MRAPMEMEMVISPIQTVDGDAGRDARVDTALSNQKGSK